MTLPSTIVRRRSVRHRGANAVVAILAALLVAAGLGSAQPASAATFLISTPDNSFFAGTVTLTGTKDIASTVEIPSLTGGDPYCTEPATGAPASESWSCTFSLADGIHTIRVLEYPASGSPTEASITVRVLGAPVISGPQLNRGRLTGTGYPGAGIALSGVTLAGPCTASTTGFWECLIAEPSGNYSVTAAQVWEGTADRGATSAPFALTVDKDAPPLPIFAQPAAGSRLTSQPTTFAGGNGEAGARVDVFVDGTAVCSSPVTSGQWSCSASLPAGNRSIQAIQWDAAGNPSGTTTAYTVTVGAASSQPGTPATPPQPGEPAAPGTPESPGTPEPSPSVTPTPTPSSTPYVPPRTPFFPPPVGGESGLPPWDTWGTPTDYGAAIPPASTVANTRSLLLAAALGAGFILFVALPLRLAVTALQRRIGPRAAPPRDEEPLVTPAMAATLALGAAVLFAALAGGIQGEARYLRLALGIAIALGVLNAIGVLIARFVGRGFGEASIRVIPTLVGLAALSALLSRGGGIQPPILVGVVVLAGAYAAGTSGRRQGAGSLLHLGALTGTAVVAWLAHSALGPVEGFGPSLASETLAVLCLAALGSVLVLLLPVGAMPGRQLFRWSPLTWVGLTFVSASMGALVVASSPSFPLAWAIGACLTFAAIATAVWAWITLVEPQAVAPGREVR